LIERNTARAEIPVPDPDMAILVFGNVYDTRKVLTSTLPVEATPRALGIEKATGRPITNGCPRGRFESEDTIILRGTAQSFGRDDNTTAHSGKQSIALDPPKEDAKPKRARSEVRVMLFNVYERDHRLYAWLRAERAMTVDLRVRALPPANWNSPAVQALLTKMPLAAGIPSKGDIPVFSLAAKLGPEWKEFALDVRFTGVAIEGYELHVDRRPGENSIYWIDDVRFETQWQAAGE
jgi:hypothetical protein